MQTTHDTKNIVNDTIVPDSVMELWNITRGWICNRIVEPARKRRLYRQAVAELQMLDDRTLRDIGIDRFQIPIIAYQCAYGSAGGRAIDGHEPVQAANDNQKTLNNGASGADSLLDAA